jgi:hypothetical protein
MFDSTIINLRNQNLIYRNRLTHTNVGCMGVHKHVSILFPAFNFIYVHDFYISMLKVSVISMHGYFNDLCILILNIKNKYTSALFLGSMVIACMVYLFEEICLLWSCILLLNHFYWLNFPLITWIAIQLVIAISALQVIIAIHWISITFVSTQCVLPACKLAEDIYTCWEHIGRTICGAVDR